MATRAEGNLVYASGTVQGSRSSPSLLRAGSSPTLRRTTVTSQYGVMFVPQVVTAIAASILGADHGSPGSVPVRCSRRGQPAGCVPDRRWAAVVLGVLSFVVVKQRAAPGPLASQTRGAGRSRRLSRQAGQPSRKGQRDEREGQGSDRDGGNSGIGKGIVLALAKQGEPTW